MTSSPTTPTINDLARVERLVGELRSRKRSKIEMMPGVGDALAKRWLPNPGPQTDAYHSLADELFYGGEAGGGKSDLLEGLALNEHESSLLLRRTNKEASKFIKRFSEIVGDRKGWNGQLATFTLPGSTSARRVIEFGGCQLEDDKQKYKGDPHDFIGFDEIADFTESQYRFIIGWNRSARKGQRCRVVAAGNPPTRPEGLWVLKYWGAWLDPTHRKPAKPGELRWYTTIGGEDREVDGPGPHLVDGEMIQARSRSFIPAELTDKEKIAADERIKTLEAKRDVLVAEGNSRLNAIMRAGFGIPPMIYLGKLYLFDKVLGWGTTDPLSPELWNVLWTVVGFYFLDQIAGRVTRRK